MLDYEEYHYYHCEICRNEMTYEERLNNTGLCFSCEIDYVNKKLDEAFIMVYEEYYNNQNLWRV